MIECKIGVCGFWLILELILFDIMYELLGFKGVKEVVIFFEVVKGEVCLLYIYEDCEEIFVMSV